MNELAEILKKNVVQIIILAITLIVGYSSLLYKVEANTSDIVDLQKSKEVTIVNTKDIAVIQTKLDNIQKSQDELKDLIKSLANR